MDNSGDLAFVNLLRHEKLCPEDAIQAALAAAEKIRALGVSAGIADVLVDRGLLPVSKAEELKRMQSLTSLRPIQRNEVAAVSITPDEDKQVATLAVRYCLLPKEQYGEAEGLVRQIGELGCRLRLSEVLVERKALQPEALFALLQIYRTPKPPTGPTGYDELLFGAAVIQNKLAPAEKVQKALGVQMRLAKAAGVRQGLGEVLVSNNVLRPEDAKRVVELLRLRKPEAEIDTVKVAKLTPEESDRVVQILQDNSLITPEALEECVSQQQQMRQLGLKRKLGELLIDKGYIKKEALDAAEAILDSQRFSAQQALAAAVPEAERRRSIMAGIGLGMLIIGLTVGLLTWSRWWPQGTEDVMRRDHIGVEPAESTVGDAPDWDEALRRAEAPLAAEDYPAAIKALAILEGTTIAPAHRTRVGLRLRQARGLDRLWRDLEARVRDPQQPKVHVTFWDHTGWTVTALTRAKVTLAGDLADSATEDRAWRDLDPRDSLTLFTEAGLPATEPYGLACFCATKGVDVPAEALELLGRGDRKDIATIAAAVPKLPERAAVAAPINVHLPGPVAGPTPPVTPAVPAAVDPRQLAALALDAQAALLVKIAEQLRLGRFEEGRAILARWLDSSPARATPLWQSYAASLDRLKAFRDQVNAGIAAAPKPIKSDSIPGFESLDGKLAGATAEGITVKSGGAQLLKPWRDLTPAGLRAIAAAVLTKGEPYHAAIAFFLLESGHADAATSEWEQATAAGEDVAALLAWFHARQDTTLLAVWRKGLADAEKLAIATRPGEALDALGGLREPEFGVPAADRDRVAAVRERAGAAVATAALAEADRLAAAGNAEDAVAALEAALRRLGDDARPAEGLRTRLAAVRGTLERVLATFDTPADLARWQISGTTVVLCQDPEMAKSPPGSAHWTIADDEKGGMLLPIQDGDFRTFEGLALWVKNEKGSLSQFEIRIETSVKDYYAYDVALTQIGTSEVKAAFAKCDRQGTPDLGRIQQVRLWHFGPGAGGEVYLDDLRLLHKLAAAEIASRPPVKPGPGEAGPGGGGGGDGKVGPGNPPVKPPVKPPDDPGKAGRTGRAARKGPTLNISDAMYVNLEYGLCLTPPARWETIPPPKDLNPQFRGDTGPKSLVRFKAREPDQDNYELVLDLYSLGKAETLEEAFATYCTWEKERNAKYDLPPKMQKEQVNKMPAAWFQIVGERGFLHSVELIQGYGEGYALVFTCGTKYGQRKAEDFRRVGRSFAFLNDEQVQKLTAKKGGGGGASLPPGWSSFQTAHYEIQYNCDEAFAQTLGKHLEAILAEYQRRFPLDLDKAVDETGEAKGYRRFTVKTFKGYEEFSSYAATNGVSGAAAYFSPAQNELVAYKTVDEGKAKTFHIIYHEASHQYMYLWMGGDVDIPTWLNEGVGDYFYGGEFDAGGRLVIGPAHDRVEVLKEAVHMKKLVPLPKLFKYSQQQYYADAQLCYAEGWGICYFLWTTQDPKYKPIMDKMYQSLRKLKDKEKAFAEAFAGVDLDQLDADWQKWLATPGGMR